MDRISGCRTLSVMLRRALAIAVAFIPALVLADVQVRTCTIVLGPGATAEDRQAARELQSHLSLITGGTLAVKEVEQAPDNSIVVGSGPLSRKLLPKVRWEALRGEQTLVQSAGNVLVVAGGAPRGTLYAAYRLLQEKCGVRWWAPWAATVPKNPELVFGAMDWSETPAFEYRDPYWFHAFDADWAARNFNNGFNTRVDDARGGKTLYEGFVHTYSGLVPPAQFFAIHPEWFSEINGHRTAEDSQLCTTNPQLRAYVLEQVRKRLRANPKATIVSVSQNDAYNPCTCATCRALADREGSQAALVLDLANYVADGIRDEFPNVAVDTLAYQWSRHPTRNMRPRPNVIVRLCSIECNFAQPLYSVANKAFADDIRGWSRLTQRLYIWDYCTNFAHYLQPQPDYFSLGQSIQWFASNGVKGVFEEGAYQSMGADMAEMKAWITAQLLWNPKLDPEKLMDEFLEGYYGAAAPPIKRYLVLMANEAQATHVSFNLASDAPFLRYEVMGQAMRLWNEARRLAAPSGEEFVARVEMSALSPELTLLSNWSDFRYAASRAGDGWPMENSRQGAIRRWIDTAQGSTLLPGYKPITALDEGMMSPTGFLAGLGPEPPITKYVPLPTRKASPSPPAGVAAGVDFQDDLANLWKVPTGSELRADPKASDGIAAWMPGNHHEWGFQMLLSKRPISGRYRIYAVVRIDASVVDDSTAFSVGIYDNANRRDLATKSFSLRQATSDYQAFSLGEFDVNPAFTVWVAPSANPRVQGVWVDRIFFEPVR